MSKSNGEGICWQKLGPCPICLDHIKPCKCELQKELSEVSNQLNKLCEMILNLDVVVCEEYIREDGMAILKQTEFDEMFNYVHRDVRMNKLEVR